ncbi:MAG: hypothetical protein DRO93_13840, partial [Candidatus Thorarchaeota archaeon]
HDITNVLQYFIIIHTSSSTSSLMSSPPSLSPSCCQYLLLLVDLVCVQRPSAAGIQEDSPVVFVLECVEFK